ncbi:putative bifunctional diguanylate cyclase/phosphodiesterase [Thermomonas mangrovi]|uniref:putative bifunctional diguanylate cyclase/phosphodiesterase n=1 Tax=Thermomonas mangrovi TaxID=2993316 RepID=UPI0023079D13|nr:sensor domain-containing phosphodiesterase [Thermomonas mangrovi]
MALTRAIWHPDCSFDSALALICETAADALRVERVNVWHYDRGAQRLRCIHAYSASTRAHAGADTLETLSLEGDDYVNGFEGVRALDAADVRLHPSTASSLSELRSYLERHRIHALLDAPVRVEGELLGVICHECTAGPRIWSHDEITFAGSMGDFVAMAYEIVRRRRAEKEVQHLLLHDATTGLPNRDYLVELLRQRLAAPRAAGDVLAVVHVRIDPSGGVALPDDAPTADEVMGQVALRLRQLSSNLTHLARVRADGFAFVLEGNTAQRNAVRLAERCIAAVRGLQWDLKDLLPGATVGIAYAGAAADRGARVLMRQAESAAERAREHDKFGYQVFDLEHHQALLDRLRLERALRDAPAHGEFELHYQPEYDATTHTWVAAEALLRWRHQGRLRAAAEFIEVLESSGQILSLGRWVLHQACADAARWPSSPNRHARTVRVNVSARQFEDAALATDVGDALAASGLAPARLCLEITETTLMRNLDHALGVLQQLKAVGVQVALDDFGTGYGSLVYLKRLPVDVIKIDRSFVDGLPGTPADIAIVKAVFGLAESLGLEVVAEGVERAAQHRALQAIGVQRMQGWLFAKAMDQASLCGLLGQN